MPRSDSRERAKKICEAFCADRRSGLGIEYLKHLSTRGWMEIDSRRRVDWPEIGRSARLSSVWEQKCQEIFERRRKICYNRKNAVTWAAGA